MARKKNDATEEKKRFVVIDAESLRFSFSYPERGVQREEFFAVISNIVRSYLVGNIFYFLSSATQIALDVIFK